MLPGMETFVESMPQGRALWPTPQAAYDGRTDEAWRAAKSRAKARHKSGEYAKGTGAPGMMDLQRAVRLDALNPLTSSAAASPASPSAWRVSDVPRPTSGGSGPSSHESFAHYDPDSSCWRTCQGSFTQITGEPLARWSETWPRAGMTRSGIAYQRQPLAPLTDVIASGLWPTPVTNGSVSQITMGAAVREAQRKGENNSLATAVASRMWPTPTAGDAKSAGSRNLPGSEAHAGVSLTDAVRFGNSTTPRKWPTPSATDWKGSSRPGQRRGQLSEAIRFPTPRPCSGETSSGMNRAEFYRAMGFDPSSDTKGGSVQSPIGGSLNPTWVEWLMGFPLGWTDCGPSATASSRKSRNGSDAD
jgi:hypothetical protein